MKNTRINPVGLKGNQITERIIELMGTSMMNESAGRSSVELTKVGPDGKAYAIVRENQTYFIKLATKTTGLVMEDFNYMGGLKNKHSEAYPSYAKAIKHLNLNFKSLSEAYGEGGDINVFEDDNLLNENGSVAGFSSNSGNGFSGAGNLDENTPLYEEEDDEEGFNYEGLMGNETDDEDYYDDDLTEEERAIDAMIAEDREEALNEASKKKVK